MGARFIHSDDEHLVSQLASLQDMHDQIYHLRTLPQALVSPVSEMLRSQTLPSIGSDGPAKLYARIQKTAVEGLREVESFKQSWLSNETQELWKRSLNESYPQGSDVWRVDYIKTVRESSAEKQGRASTIEIPATDTQELKNVMKDFHEKHPTMKIEPLSTTGVLPFDVRVAGMVFRAIEVESAAEAEYELQYNQDSQRTQLHDGILRHLNQRQPKGNLEFLLSMIASYEDVKRRPCDKCCKLIDKNLTFPVLRDQKAATTPEGERNVSWKASHVGCA